MRSRPQNRAGGPQQGAGEPQCSAVQWGAGETQGEGEPQWGAGETQGEGEPHYGDGGHHLSSLRALGETWEHH